MFCYGRKNYNLVTLHQKEEKMDITNKWSNRKRVNKHHEKKWKVHITLHNKKKEKKQLTRQLR